MIADEIRRYALAQPFPPYAIHLADGRSFEIYHPDNAVLGDRDRTVSVLNHERLIEIINVFLIASLRPIRLSRKQKQMQR